MIAYTGGKRGHMCPRLVQRLVSKSDAKNEKKNSTGTYLVLSVITCLSNFHAVTFMFTLFIAAGLFECSDVDEINQNEIQ